MGHSGSRTGRLAALGILAMAVVLSSAGPAHGKSGKSPLTVKVLDAVLGAPAAGVALKVNRKTADGSWKEVAHGLTDQAGEVNSLISKDDFVAGSYRVDFDTKSYWKTKNRTPFHEESQVMFAANPDGKRHYTLALLLSPFSYTTTAVVIEPQE